KSLQKRLILPSNTRSMHWPAWPEGVSRAWAKMLQSKTTRSRRSFIVRHPAGGVVFPLEAFGQLFFAHAGGERLPLAFAADLAEGLRRRDLGLEHFTDQLLDRFSRRFRLAAKASL